jgi:hypothetical protein
MAYNYGIDAVSRSTGSTSLNMFATAPAGVEQKVSPSTVFTGVSIANALSISLATFIPGGANGMYVIDCECPASGNYAVTGVGSIVDVAGTITAVGFNAQVIGAVTGSPITALGRALLSNGGGDGVYLYQNSGAALIYNITVTKLGSF